MGPTQGALKAMARTKMVTQGAAALRKEAEPIQITIGLRRGPLLHKVASTTAP